jgi:hypothetical protein
MPRALPENVVELFPPGPPPEPQMPGYSPEVVLINAMFMVLSRRQQLRVTQLIFKLVRDRRDCPVLLGALKAADRMWGV